MKIRLALCALGMALSWAAPDAAAQQQRNEAAAEALFREARQLMAQGELVAACEKFAASDGVSPSVGARISLGQCYARRGMTASAWTSYRAAENLAKQRRDGRARHAAALAAELEPQLSYMVIEVSEPVPELVVELDGKPQAPALLGQRFPVDPGAHEIAARAPGRQPWSQSVTAGEAGALVEIEIPALAPIATTTPEPEPEAETEAETEPEPEAGAQPPRTEPPPAADVAGTAPGRFRLYGAVTAGTGGALLITGLVFGALAKSKLDESDPLCEGNRCSPEGAALVDEARTRANTSTVLVAVGLAAAGTGLALYLLAPESDGDGDGAAASVSPTLSPSMAGLSFSGRF